MKKEEVLNFDIIFQSWKGEITSNSENYLVREKKIRTLLKKKIPKISFKSYFSQFKEGKDLKKEFIRIGKKMAGDIIEEPAIFFNELFENTYFKFVDENSQLAKRISGKISKKGYSKVYTFLCKDVPFVSTDKGCKESCLNTSYVDNEGNEYATVTDTYYLIGLVYAIKEVERLAREGFDFYQLLHQIDEKVWRKIGNDDIPHMEIPQFYSEEEAKKKLGKNAKEISCSKYRCLYSLIYEGTIPLPERKVINFRKIRDKETYYFLPSWRYKDNWCLTFFMICDAVIKEQAARRINEKYERVVSGDYARSFETKKHINKKTIEAMKKTGFNRFFGFVEFDNDVDLLKVEEVYREFKDFNKFIFGEYVSTPDTSIRFRKLGQHKATGLYCPGFDCICVDIENPYSLVHEYGHMLDYHNGIVSEKYDFQKIRADYEILFDKNVAESKKKLTGKYDKKYYLTPTEIFARCFEIYVKHKGLDNSIIEQEFDFAYPSDEHFVEMVTEYFEKFLENMKD